MTFTVLTDRQGEFPIIRTLPVYRHGSDTHSGLAVCARYGTVTPSCDFTNSLYLYTGRRFSPVRVNSEPPGDANHADDDEVYEVRVIDNDYNTYREVMDITMLALHIPEQEAYAIAWEVDHNGSCVVAYGPRRDAEEIASIIRTIGIVVEVKPTGKTWERTRS